MQISAEYVPLFYLMFGLFMAGSAALGVIGFFQIRKRFGLFADQMEAKAGIPAYAGISSGEGRDQTVHLQPVWPERQFPKLRLPAYATNWWSLFFKARFTVKMGISTRQRQDEELPWLWFEGDFRYPVGWAPEGRVSVSSSQDQVELAFRYAGGEESADIRVNGEPFGSLRLEVQHGPWFLADVDLFDASGASVGRWQNTPVSTGPILNEIPETPSHGSVTVHGDQIARMLIFYPRRWKKGGFQALIDRLHLFIVPDPAHLFREEPLLREVSPDLSEAQRRWLLALIGLQVWKLSFKIPGKKR